MSEVEETRGKDEETQQPDAAETPAEEPQVVRQLTLTVMTDGSVKYNVQPALLPCDLCDQAIDLTLT